MPRPEIKFFKKIIISLLTMFIIVSLFLPQITQAQFVDAIGGPSQIISTIWDKYFIPAWKRFGAVAYKNAINLYLGQMAKETA